jgi:hypothetical protein
MRLVGRAVAGLQRSQLSVQALTRLCSVVVFLLASWTDTGHLPLVALQGALFAIPYTLLEALIGRPLSAGLVPAAWNVDAWARKAAAATVVPVAAVGYLSASVALPHSSQPDRLLMIAPVLLQLPLEAVFWAWTRTRSRQAANLVPQLTAAGTLLAGAAFAVLHVRMDVAFLPAQVAVLCWALARRPARSTGDARPVLSTGDARPVLSTGDARPALRPSLAVGSAYCLAAAIDLCYAVALPSVAGAVVGQSAIVVVRAMELAFGPFHVALAAATREDVVAGRGSRLLNATRALTVAALLVVSVLVLGSAWVRHLLAADLGRLGVAVVALYCGYKALAMVSTWLSVRHMIWAAPRRFLVSAVGSRVVAFGGLALSVLWARHVSELFLLLLLGEALVVCWYAVRIRNTPAVPATVAPYPLSDGVADRIGTTR